MRSSPPSLKKSDLARRRLLNGLSRQSPRRARRKMRREEMRNTTSLKNEDPARFNEVTNVIIGAAISVHRELGPGLLESTYEACLNWELVHRGLRVERQVAVPVIYHSVEIDAAYRVDLLVEDAVVVELKAVDQLLEVHKAQLLSYLKLSGRKVGLIINFNTQILKDGIRRVVSGFEDPPPSSSAISARSAVKN